MKRSEKHGEEEEGAEEEERGQEQDSNTSLSLLRSIHRVQTSCHVVIPWSRKLR